MAYDRDRVTGARSHSQFDATPRNTLPSGRALDNALHAQGQIIRVRSLAVAGGSNRVEAHRVRVTVRPRAGRVTPKTLAFQEREADQAEIQHDVPHIRLGLTSVMRRLPVTVAIAGLPA